MGYISLNWFIYSGKDRPLSVSKGFNIALFGGQICESYADVEVEVKL